MKRKWRPPDMIFKGQRWGWKMQLWLSIAYWVMIISTGWSIIKWMIGR